MPCTPEKIASNRRNSEKSTGPKTPEGKERSRRNGLKHGLTGEGIVLPTEDQAEVTERFIDLQDDLRPKTKAGRLLVRRFALLSVRIERCERHETAETSKRIRYAIAQFDDERLTEVEGHFRKLYSEPLTTVRRLQATPEGIDLLLNEWAILRADLLNPDRNCWTSNHRSHFDGLLGLNPGGYRVARIMALSEALFGSFHYLDKADGEGLEGPARSEWARGELARLIDVETTRLKEVRASLDHEALALDREEAVNRALFDPSKEMVLARKYEAATERAMFKTLKDLREVEAAAAERPADDTNPSEEETCETVASDFSEPEEEPTEDESPVELTSETPSLAVHFPPGEISDLGLEALGMRLTGVR